MSGDVGEWAAGLLLVAGGILALVGAIGLVRLRDFFERMHPVALGATLGCWCVSTASVIVSSADAGTLVLRAWLIPLFLSITMPVTTVLLARAALFRRRAAGDDMPPRLSTPIEAPSAEPSERPQR